MTDDDFDRLFLSGMPPVEDNGFSREVMVQIDRRQHHRWIMLTLAAGVGAIIAGPAVIDLALRGGHAMSAYLLSASANPLTLSAASVSVGLGVLVIYAVALGVLEFEV